MLCQPVAATIRHLCRLLKPRCLCEFPNCMYCNVVLVYLICGSIAMDSVLLFHWLEVLIIVSLMLFFHIPGTRISCITSLHHVVVTSLQWMNVQYVLWKGVGPATDAMVWMVRGSHSIHLLPSWSGRSHVYIRRMGRPADDNLLLSVFDVWPWLR